MQSSITEQLQKISIYTEKYPYALLPEEVKDAYEREMLLRLSWNTNYLEGNTLSLNETIDVIEYDEVRSGHTYSEYREAESVFRANEQMLDFRTPRVIDLAYISDANAMITGSNGSFRENRVYIGTLAESAYVPPSPEQIPELMRKYAGRLIPSSECSHMNFEELVRKAAVLHMDFERIHPFRDGNGRTGRLFLNQYLLNHGLAPVIIENNAKYRQAFRYYDRSEDTSFMEYCLSVGIVKSYEVLEENVKKLMHG